MLEVASIHYADCRFSECLRLVEARNDAASLELAAKALLELDRAEEACELLRPHAFVIGESRLRYWYGVCLYAARADRVQIEAVFRTDSQTATSYEKLGLVFLKYCAGNYDDALVTANSIVAAGDIEHVRRMMIVQILLDASRLDEAKVALDEANVWLRTSPTVMRNFWQDLMEIRFLRAGRRFDSARCLADRLRDRIGGSELHRLQRNLDEAIRLIEREESQDTVRLPTEEGLKLAGELGLRGKPMLNSLFSELFRAAATGLTKEEIADRVWGEVYNPLVHNERIYKSINRLNKHISLENRQHHISQNGSHYVLCI